MLGIVNCYCVLKRKKNVTQIIDLIMSNKMVYLIKKNDSKWIEFKKMWSWWLALKTHLLWGKISRNLIIRQLNIKE
jgi:hypothetical protein